MRARLDKDLSADIITIQTNLAEQLLQKCIKENDESDDDDENDDTDENLIGFDEYLFGS